MVSALIPFEELNLYLVRNNLKPVGMISLSSLCSEEQKQEFAKNLEIPNRLNKSGFYIAKDQESLEKLVNAKTDEETGIALGYPIEAVKTYQKTINGEKRDGSYVVKAIEKGVNAGKEIPLWLGYIYGFFVPEEIDVVNNRYSPYYSETGKRYQEHVRKNDPDLANRVEDAFRKSIAIQVGLDKKVKFL
jgi:hypothetical protein